ncbi:hypothetical protein LR013_00240 [candidate division NPL-UPA2 bacterium]|nr:hypothetical protein [candidate division NPL-UPA2 bacterium]
MQQARKKRRLSLFAYYAVRFNSRPVGREGYFYTLSPGGEGKGEGGRRANFIGRN